MAKAEETQSEPVNDVADAMRIFDVPEGGHLADDDLPFIVVYEAPMKLLSVRFRARQGHNDQASGRFITTRPAGWARFADGEYRTRSKEEVKALERCPNFAGQLEAKGLHPTNHPDRFYRTLLLDPITSEPLDVDFDAD